MGARKSRAMMNDDGRWMGEEQQDGGTEGEGSGRWGGNEAGMRVISWQEVRNRAAGRRVSHVFVSLCVCVCVCLPPATGRGGPGHRSRSIFSRSQPEEEEQRRERGRGGDYSY